MCEYMLSEEESADTVRELSAIESLSVNEGCLMPDPIEAKDWLSSFPKIFLGAKGLLIGEGTLEVVATQESRCSYLDFAKALASANVVGVFHLEAAGVFLSFSSCFHLEIAGFLTWD